jgi:hypothetical protein
VRVLNNRSLGRIYPIMSLHPGEQGVCAKHGQYDEFCGKCSDLKGCDTMRAKIVAYSDTIRNSDSKRETAQAVIHRDEAITWLRSYCPHDLIVVRYTEGRDYEENCATAGMHQCVRCGLTETGYNATVTANNEWCSGSYKILKAEPFARFEHGEGYRKVEGGVQGIWSMGDPLDHDLDTLLAWIKKVGYPHASAAWHKAYDKKKSDEKAEKEYQWFKAKYIDRLTREIVENYFSFKEK